MALISKETPHYISAMDKFMSGWGAAENKSNRFCVECTEGWQIDVINAALEDRDEMKRIVFHGVKKPKTNKTILYSHKTYEELGAVWKTYERNFKVEA